MSIELYAEKRPWGGFRQFTKNKVSTVKILTVKAGEELSLQYHHHREEFWHVISGEGEVTIGEKILPAKKGDEFSIPVETNHIIKASSPMEILEISFGEFDEEDIIRLQDKYGRAPA